MKRDHYRRILKAFIVVPTDPRRVDGQVSVKETILQVSG